MKLLKEYKRAYRHKKILKAIDVPKNGTVLDLSCADGKFINRLHNISPNLKLFGVDISSDEIKEAQTNLPFANFSTENSTGLSFGKNTFDHIFSIMSLHHYENPEKVFEKISSILKTNGTLFLVDIVLKNTLVQKIYNWRKCTEPYHFEKFYLIEDLKKTIEPFGFDITEDKKISLIPEIRLVNIIKKS